MSMVLATLCFSSFGCVAGDIKDVCEDIIACEGGNDDDEKACVALLKGERKAQDNYGCRDEFDDLFICQAEYGRCDRVDVGIYTTENEEGTEDPCSAARSAYNACGGIESAR